MDITADTIPNQPQLNSSSYLEGNKKTRVNYQMLGHLFQAEFGPLSSLGPQKTKKWKRTTRRKHSKSPTKILATLSPKVDRLLKLTPSPYKRQSTDARLPCKHNSSHASTPKIQLEMGSSGTKQKPLVDLEEDIDNSKKRKNISDYEKHTTTGQERHNHLEPRPSSLSDFENISPATTLESDDHTYQPMDISANPASWGCRTQ
ncbi:hypothetical protein PanWU01x14_185820 [Parasponia andersonii]|uniref:Uncharacterized protein n=1 Tax=Parasponia andersonii TaxID=3476 RepID=A0A2P5C3Y0_PARAD|nr:hypothetical protein PanWU01x14_185820 [Parasponia andersonii]